MNYIVVQLKSSDDIEPLHRRKYVDSLYDKSSHVGEVKLGFISKFSNALGFKKYDNFEYGVPKTIISENIFAYPKGDNIIEFYIERGNTVAHDNSFEYNNPLLAYKWADFLKKIFPELDVSVKKSSCKPGRKESLTSHFFTIVEEYPMSSDTSLDTKLSKDEIDSIKEILTLYKDPQLKFKLFQFECSTCKEHSEKFPIHLELDVSIDRSKDKVNYKRKCYNCNIESEEELCVDCSVILENKIILSVN